MNIIEQEFIEEFESCLDAIQDKECLYVAHKTKKLKNGDISDCIEIYDGDQSMNHRIVTDSLEKIQFFRGDDIDPIALIHQWLLDSKDWIDDTPWYMRWLNYFSPLKEMYIKKLNNKKN